MPVSTKAKPRAKTKTVRLTSGARVRLSADGKVTAAPELEWRLQAAAVTALRKMAGYGTLFTFAGDFNAGKRNAAKAKATGLTPGETDLRFYIKGGHMLLAELKAKETTVSADQVKRHKELTGLGFKVIVIRAVDSAEMAAKVCAAVAFELSWLGVGVVA